MLKIGVVGGTGYTGVELLRLLAMHPEVEIACVTSRSEAGRRVSDLFPNLRGYVDIPFTEPDVDLLASCDLVFFATPNGTAMKLTPELLDKGARVIDLAADFRIKDIAVWEQWYGMSHACPEVVAEAVYGLPERNREAIGSARVIANPGCYPTAVTLGFLPLLENGLVKHQHLIADAKSGVSGAGRGASVGSLLSEASENFKAYGVAGHRHHPEISQNLALAAGHDIGLTFVPHLTPMIRGIEATLYAVADSDIDAESLHQIYTERYADERFVDVLPPGSLPETRSVRGNNCCRISVFRPMQGDMIVVSSVIDNLVKGAAGQAIQNMNLMTGLDEACGLDHPAFMP